MITFNRSGFLYRTHVFQIGKERLENVRSYKYLGLKFTPSGEISTALKDLRSRALKAYYSMKDSLNDDFNKWVVDTMKIFDTCVKPILLYGSDFWGALKLPQNDPVEKTHLKFCKELLGVQRKTTSMGVYLE